jgi:ferritin-like metal-binding protein YciE
MFLEELADIYDAEQRVLKVLPKLIATATCEDLESTLRAHLGETKIQLARVEKIFVLFGEKAKAKKCPAMAGLINEGKEVLSHNRRSPTLNAAIISAAQKIEHYEIASYGCLREWSKLLGQNAATKLLEESLEEEKAADSALSGLSTVKNEEAMCFVVEE